MVRAEDLWVSFRPRGRKRGFARRGEPRWALRGVSISSEPGALTGVIGANGSGKTTLLQTIAGVVRPDRGTVTAPGRVASLVDIAAGQNRDLPAVESIMLAGVLAGMSRAAVREAMPGIIAFSGLAEADLALPLYTYSAGMTMRLLSSVTVHAGAPALVLDEVLAVADAAYLQTLMHRIDEMRAAGCSVIMASHDLDMIRERCDEATWLRDGEVAAHGPADETVAAYESWLKERSPLGPAAHLPSPV